MPKKSDATIPATFQAERYLTRARQFRTQAIQLADQEGYEPNWPKFFLMSHAVELAITTYLVLEKGLGKPPTAAPRRPKPRDHDLIALYNDAVSRGLPSNALVLKDLPFLSEVHRVHYARYPKIVSMPVPAFISEYDGMLDQLLDDVRKAF